jgi:hypothetical protein
VHLPSDEHFALCVNRVEVFEFAGLGGDWKIQLGVERSMRIQTDSRFPLLQHIMIRSFNDPGRWPGTTRHVRRHHHRFPAELGQELCQRSWSDRANRRPWRIVKCYQQ